MALYYIHITGLLKLRIFALPSAAWKHMATGRTTKGEVREIGGSSGQERIGPEGVEGGRLAKGMTVESVKASSWVVGKKKLCSVVAVLAAVVTQMW